jgi:hypothetical protein
MARVGRRKAPILTNDNPMLPFAWEEIAAVECVPAPVVKPALVPKPRPNPAPAPVLSRRPVTAFNAIWHLAAGPDTE